MNRSSEYARLLLQRARDDAYVLTQLSEDPESPAWTLGFHAQQAIEKAIKAVLSSKGAEIPHTHDLVWLLELLSETGLDLPSDAVDFPRLTPYGAALRYDETAEPAGSEIPDRQWLLSCVNRTLDWAEKNLS